MQGHMSPFPEEAQAPGSSPRTWLRPRSTWSKTSNMIFVITIFLICWVSKLKKNLFFFKSKDIAIEDDLKKKDFIYVSQTQSKLHFPKFGIRQKLIFLRNYQRGRFPNHWHKGQIVSVVPISILKLILASRLPRHHKYLLHVLESISEHPSSS